ncbi:MAG: YDG domain-containing protein [Bifidobacteriaceae bacterium]|nr:YDG domain-containing protein [Bifidobacteriaceae bacterium]
MRGFSGVGRGLGFAVLGLSLVLGLLAAAIPALAEGSDPEFVRVEVPVTVQVVDSGSPNGGGGGSGEIGDGGQPGEGGSGDGEIGDEGSGGQDGLPGDGGQPGDGGLGDGGADGDGGSAGEDGLPGEGGQPGDGGSGEAGDGGSGDGDADGEGGSVGADSSVGVLPFTGSGLWAAGLAVLLVGAGVTILVVRAGTGRGVRLAAGVLLSVGVVAGVGGVVAASAEPAGPSAADGVVVVVDKGVSLTGRATVGLDVAGLGSKVVGVDQAIEAGFAEFSVNGVGVGASASRVAEVADKDFDGRLELVLEVAVDPDLPVGTYQAASVVEAFDERVVVEAVEAAFAPKQYDGTDALLPTAAPVVVGVADGDEVALEGLGFSAAGVEAAAGQSVTARADGLSGEDAWRYRLASPVLRVVAPGGSDEDGEERAPAVAAIVPRELVVAGLAAEDRVYDGTDAVSLTGRPALGGVVGDDKVFVTGTPSARFESKDAGADKAVAFDLGSFALEGADAANYVLRSPQLTASVAPKPLGVTGLAAQDKTYDGAVEATITGDAVLVGVEAADQVTLGGVPKGEFDSKSAGDGKAVALDADAVRLAGADAGNYTFDLPGLTASVTRQTLTVAGWTAQDKVYDGTQDAHFSGTGSLVGVVAGDQVSLTGAPFGAFDSKAAGADKPVTVDPASVGLAGADAANYVLDVAGEHTASVAVKEVTVDGLAAEDKTYDAAVDASFTGAAVLVGAVTGDDVAVQGAPSGRFDSKNVGDVKVVTLDEGSLTLAGEDAANYALALPELTAAVAPRELGVAGLAAEDKIYDRTEAASLTGAGSLVGVVDDDLVWLAGAPVGVFDSAAAGEGKTVTVDPDALSLAGEDAQNYTLRLPQLTASVAPKGLSVAGLTANGKVYDGTADASFAGEASLTGVVDGDAVSLEGAPVGAFDSEDAGADKAVTLSADSFALTGEDAANYTLGLPELRASITPKRVDVTGLTAVDKVYDGSADAVFAGSPVLSGAVGQDPVWLTGVPSGWFGSGDAGANKTVTLDPAALRLDGSGAPNHVLHLPGFTASIIQKDLAITGLTAVDKTYDGTAAAVFDGTPELTGEVGQDDVSLTGTARGVFASAAAGGAKAVTLNPGAFGLAGGHAANYALTLPEFSATITPRELVIAGLTAEDKAYDGNEDASFAGTAALVGVVEEDSVSLDGAARGVFDSMEAGQDKAVKLDADSFALSGPHAANYTLSLPELTASINPKALTVTDLTAVDKIYDGTAAASFTGAPALAGVVGKDEVRLVGSPAGRFDSEEAGTGRTVTLDFDSVSLVGEKAGNYRLDAAGPYTASIKPKELTLEGLTAEDKTYNGTADARFAGQATLAGVVEDDAVWLEGSPAGAFDSKDVGEGRAVTLRAGSLTLSGGDAPNYALRLPVMAASISPQVVTLEGLTAEDKTYDGTADATFAGEATLSGVVDGETVSVKGTPRGLFDSKNAGDGKTVTFVAASVELDGAGAGNYILGVGGQYTASVARRPVTFEGSVKATRDLDDTDPASFDLRVEDESSFGNVLHGEALSLSADAVSAVVPAGDAFGIEGTSQGVVTGQFGLSAGAGASVDNYTLAEQPTAQVTIAAARIVLRAEITAGGQQVKLNKYFANGYTVDWGDGTPVEQAPESATGSLIHVYDGARDGGYKITLTSLLTGEQRWTFRNGSAPLVPKSGTTAARMVVKKFPKLRAFMSSQTRADDHFFRSFNYSGALAELAPGSFDTSDITWAGDHFFDDFNLNGKLERLPEGSFDTSAITRAGSYFFAYFNYYGVLTGLPEGSFGTSSITSAGFNFFVAFNYYGALTKLPEGSFDTSRITSAGSEFFAAFNYAGALTELPAGSFNTRRVLQVGSGFFAYFNYRGQLATLPDSFRWPALDKTTASQAGNFQEAFNSSIRISRAASEIIGGCATPDTDRNTFSDNQPGVDEVDDNWRQSPRESEGNEERDTQ